MNERMPLHEPNPSGELTIEMTNSESFEVSPHNTSLFEFTDQAASRNHVFFLTSTTEGDLRPMYLFRTFDPEAYDGMREHILANPDYEVVLSDEVDPCEERAYQQQVDHYVEAWSHAIPETDIDFLIATAK